MLIRIRRARPGAVPGVLATALLLAACGADPAPRMTAERPATPVFDLIDPAWRRAPVLDISFVAVQDGEPSSRVRTALILDPAGTVTAAHTTETAGGVVVFRGDWTRGGASRTAEAPGCTADTEPVDLPDGLAEVLAEAFGPVDTATAAGWMVAAGAATRPGPGGDTVESAPLTPLPRRTITETETRSGRVVAETREITVRPVARAPRLPQCGARQT